MIKIKLKIFSRWTSVRVGMDLTWGRWIVLGHVLKVNLIHNPIELQLDLRCFCILDCQIRHSFSAWSYGKSRLFVSGNFIPSGYNFFSISLSAVSQITY